MLNEVAYPFDYFSRRLDKKNEGKIVYVNRIINGLKEMVDEPFLIISKQAGNYFGLRLKNISHIKQFKWVEDQWSKIQPTYLITNKVLITSYDEHTLAPIMTIGLQTEAGRVLFEVDLAKWYQLKQDESGVGENITLVVDPNNFNLIISKYIEFNPMNELADKYSYTNWEEGK